MTGEWSRPDRVIEYLGREIPHRGLAEGLLIAALPKSLERVIDLGTGDGRLLALVGDHRPTARGIGLDSSAPMLTRAAARVAGDNRFEVRFGDLAETLELQGGVDAVVSGLALHHLEHERKRSLFSEVFALLRPGGTFVNLDLVTSPSEQAHREFRELIGRIQDDPSDRLAELGAQLGWLREAGFIEVDCPFKWLELALMVARRPT